MVVIVFDFDGVLIDSKRMYVELIHLALNENGVKIPYKEIDKKLIPSIKATIENVTPKNIKDRTNVKISAEKRVIGITSTEGLEYIKLNKDAINTLVELKKDNRIFLLSNSHSSFINKALNKFNLKQYFKEIITLDSGFMSKNDALRYISKLENVDISDVIYVGDTKEDIKIATEVGCKIIVIFSKISWDYPDLDKISELDSDFMTNRLSGLIPIVNILK